MRSKVTIRDVAERAGVGTATVERVLNGRGGVRPETVQRVLAALRSLNYPKRLTERHRGVVRIEVILVRPESAFFSRLSKSYSRIAATLDNTIAVHRTHVEESNPLAIAERIANPGARRSGLILAVPEHPAIRAALAKVVAEGTPVVQIVTRMAGIRADYVGIDNVAAGRTAGLLMAGLQRQAGSVIALCHSAVYAVHRERVTGFSQYLDRAAAGHLSFACAAFTHDEDMQALDALHWALGQFPDLTGIYNAGGCTGVLCGGLRRLAAGRNICFIGHELTDDSAAALKDGTMAAVIDQAPETQARRSLDIVLHRLGLLDQPVEHAPIRFITITPESL